MRALLRLVCLVWGHAEWETQHVARMNVGYVTKFRCPRCGFRDEIVSWPASDPVEG